MSFGRNLDGFFLPLVLLAVTFAGRNHMAPSASNPRGEGIGTTDDDEEVASMEAGSCT